MNLKKLASNSIKDLLPLPGVGRLLGHLDPLLGLVLGALEEELCLRLEPLVWPRTHACSYLSTSAHSSVVGANCFSTLDES